LQWLKQLCDALPGRPVTAKQSVVSGLSRCNDANYFFVENPLNRYSISPRQNLKSNADGTTDLYIQNKSSGPDKQANWLSAPTGKFILMMRLYWPDEKSPSIIDGTWQLPAAQKVKAENVGAR